MEILMEFGDLSRSMKSIEETTTIKRTSMKSLVAFECRYNQSRILV